MQLRPITLEEYLGAFSAVLEQMRDTMARKNADYCKASADAGGEYNAFHNFLQVEQLGLTTAEVGIMTRMSDKMSRAASLLKHTAEVKDESLEDSLQDLAVYAIILILYRRWKAGKLEQQPPPKEFVQEVRGMHYAADKIVHE